MSDTKSQPAMPSDAIYYLSKPRFGKGRPVVVLHAWWGLNGFIRGFCDRLAKEGFVALAPDLYRGAVASTIEEAEKLSSALEQDVVAQDISRAVERLQDISGTNRGGIGVIGFSLGGYWALWLATQESNPVAATVVFYATRGGDYSQTHSAFQFHHAEADEFEPASEVEKMRNRLSAAGKPAEFHSYAGTTHWFFESDRTDAYRAESAQLAWERTVEFLNAHLREP